MSLTEGVGDLIDRLTGSNSKLAELIDLAANSLGGIDERLTQTTQSFAATTEKAAQTFSSSARLIDSNAGKLTELSSHTLREIASIAARFDEHSRVLTGASDLLSSAQTNLSSTLQDREKALEELAVGLVKKSEDIERVMRSYEGLVGRTLEQAEGKTRESTEHIRTAITEVVEAATQRFAEATVEIRRTANAIRSDLEETRAELRKGVMDLPNETKESTSAMRRAVTEQINALKELSEIVAKSGRMYDAPETPAPSRPAAPSAPSGSTVRPFRETPRPQLPRVGETVLTQPAKPQATPERRGAPSSEPVLRLASETDRPASARGSESSSHQQGGGWVRDLLRGASAEEPRNPAGQQASRTQEGQRSPLHVVESLNSLSVDIARAIDHEASIELWDRYRRGERNIFTRRLYTLKGQQTFDEIRRKYQNDSEFRAAVDRYCDDFEKLLKDVTQNDRDSMMTHTYLSSDTGKVYTMLAHAAGRLH